MCLALKKGAVSPHWWCHEDCFCSPHLANHYNNMMICASMAACSCMHGPALTSEKEPHEGQCCCLNQRDGVREGNTWRCQSTIQVVVVELGQTIDDRLLNKGWPACTQSVTWFATGSTYSSPEFKGSSKTYCSSTNSCVIYHSMSHDHD